MVKQKETIMKRELPVSALKHTFFARASLNELDTKRVEYLTALIEHGAVLAPIQITPDNEIIDGRHRVQSYQNLGHETIIADVIAGKSRLEYQAMALLANTGGAKPPDRGDVRFVVAQLHRHGASDATVFSLLCPAYPKRMVKQHLDWNKANELTLRFRAALKLRNDEDLTLKETADRTGLPEVDLKEFIRSGGKRRTTENFVTKIEKRWRGLNKSYGEGSKQPFTWTFDAFDNGHLTESEALKLLRIPGIYGRGLVKRSDEAIEKFVSHVKSKQQVA